MICIVPEGSRFDQAFFSRYSESDTLLLFSSYFGCSNVSVFESLYDDYNVEYYRLKYILPKSKFKKFVDKLRKPRQVSE